MSEETEEQPLVDYIAIETRTHEAYQDCQTCEISIESGLVLRITIEQAINLNSYFRRKNQKIRLVRVIPPLSIDVEKLVAEEVEHRENLRKKAIAEQAEYEKKQVAKQLAAAEKKAEKLRKLLNGKDS
jgi:hypothetical protein